MIVGKDKIVRFTHRCLGHEFLQNAERLPFMENVAQQIGNGDDACASRSLRLSDHVFPFGDISVFIEGRLYRLGADNGKGSWEKT